MDYVKSTGQNNARISYYHKEGRKVIFLGDLVDRGPKIVKVLKLVMNMVEDGNAYCVIGNHENKLLKWLKGKKVSLKHGIDNTIEELEKETAEFKEKLTVFIDSLIAHYVMDEGRLVVAHAGMKEEYQGRASGRTREFAIYGEKTGETDEYGLPVRYDWTLDYRGKACVVFGHVPQLRVTRMNNTVNVDTGCVFGGKLSAFRYPEKQIVDIAAKKVYYESQKPLADGKRYGMDELYLIDYKDIMGKGR